MVSVVNGFMTTSDTRAASMPSGVTASLKPVVSGDGAFVTVLLEATVTAVDRPIPTARLKLDANTEVSIQLPETSERTWCRAVTLPRGSSALIDLGVAPEGGGGRHAILLTATVTETVAEEKGK